MFTGFSDATIQYFLDIRFHNNAEFYNANKERYLQVVQKPFYEMIADLAPHMQAIDPEMEIRPYRCLARLRRDTRFTKDKSPYKDHLWFTFRRAAEPREGSLGFWCGLSPDWLEWGLGFWGENPKVMERFRREMVANPARIGGIVTGCNLASRHLMLAGRQAKRLEIPEVIPEHLRPWYGAKELYIQQTRPDLHEAGSRALFTHVLGDFQAMAPVYRMLRGMQDDIIREETEQARASEPLRTDEW